MSRLLVVDDDADVRDTLKELLGRAGHEVYEAPDGRTALRDAYSVRPDLVLLDVSLPELDGWHVLQRLRELSDVPVLMLSGHADAADKVRGLRAGADDYLGKPFPNNELIARVEALLRRAGTVDWADQLYDDGVLRMDPSTRDVTVGGVQARLTPTEFRLLYALVRHPGVVLSPPQLLRQAWDDPTGIGQERVKFAILRLRRKLDWSDPDTSPIESVRGFGYRYRRRVDDS
ncbi:response regulator transcription factor [Luedemannella flava]|uniref:Response regulator transcription factor n=1 Tax=Luedemannella flava TaxID=349316 RepID=A0ABP4Y947_9ACTN